MCEECRHNPCIPTCPNYDPPIVYECDNCGGAIYAGDTVYVLNNNHYCEYCCYKTEAEIDLYEQNEDEIYELWRDRSNEV